ncbi:MAG: LCP family protein, partial [Nocardioides sp.]
PPLVNTGDPDIDEVHDMVELAIDRAEGDAPPAETSKKKRGASPGTTGGSIGSLADGYAANQSADLGASC